jgi:hypothetical protein
VAVVNVMDNSRADFVKQKKMCAQKKESCPKHHPFQQILILIIISKLILLKIRMITVEL